MKNSIVSKTVRVARPADDGRGWKIDYYAVTVLTRSGTAKLRWLGTCEHNYSTLGEAEVALGLSDGEGTLLRPTPDGLREHLASGRRRRLARWLGRLLIKWGRRLVT